MVAPISFPDADARETVGQVIAATVLNAVTMALHCKNEGVPFSKFETLMSLFCDAGTELLLEKVRVTMVSKPSDPSLN